MINRNQLRLSRLTLGLMAALATAPAAFAQSTSASVTGQISGDDGRPVAGAQVTILHTQSGTVSRATTNEEGRYSSRGLRVGGPYTITIQRDGYQPTVQENVFLRIASDAQQVNAELHSTATTLEAVEVVAGRPDDVFGTNKMGAGSTITREQISGFASINRDLQDYARLDPRLAQTDKERGEISALGQNTRFNSITIDGVSINDTFGLNANGLPTNRQPISIDAIEQLEVNVSNYDVTQTNYTGANINAVTKSGGNDFHGSAIYVYRDDSFVGDDENGNSFNGFSKEETYGGTFSGPLIPDKLFFFASYEKFEQTRAGPDVRLGNNDGVSDSNEVDGITQATIDEIRQIAQDVYGFDPGNFQGLSGNLKPGSEDKLLKIDWNINDNHRASFRYNKTDQTESIFPNLSASGRNISLDTQWYTDTRKIETFVAQLYSDWSDNFSTEAKFSYRNFDSVPQVNSRLPEVRVRVGNSNVRLGTEFSRQANELHTDTYNGYFQGDWYLGDHSVRFGVDFERNEIFNLFVQGAFGQWDFNSINDFRNNRARSFLQRNPTNGDINSAAADWTLENYGFFVQDTWQVNDNLSLLFGVRLDIPRVPENPPLNQQVLNDFGLDNTTTVDGQELFQPRFGFNYTFDTEYSTQLRGGLGLFQGSAANVWLSNPFTNNGQSIVISGCGTGGLAGCGGNPPPFNADPDNQPVIIGSQPAADVDLLQGNLEQPSVWKANLALDKELSNGWVVSAEAIFTEVNKGVYYQNLNLGAPTAIGPDGRELFYNAAGLNPANWDEFGNSTGGVVATSGRNPAFRNVLIAKPTNKGNGQSYTFSLSNPSSENWYWQLAYTYQESNEVSGLTSSTASSQWGNRATFNPNENTNETSNYETRDRITAAVSYKHFFFKDYKTEITAFYEGRKGKPYSFVFDNDANGDGRFGNDLLFVPGARGDVIFGSQAEEDGFFDFMAANPNLARWAGQVAQRNSENSPWVNNVDLRFSQEIPGLFSGNKGEIWVDVLNVGNLIDEDWGQIDEVPFPFARGIVEFGGIDQATGKYVYRFNSPDNLSRRDRVGESRWRLQLGVRYTF
jgi:hypothetical protein